MADSISTKDTVSPKQNSQENLSRFCTSYAVLVTPLSKHQKFEALRWTSKNPTYWTSHTTHSRE